MRESERERERKECYEESSDPLMIVTNGQCGTSNDQVYDLSKSPDITHQIMTSTLRWPGHVKRIQENKVPTRLLKYKVRVEKELDDPGSWKEDYVRRE